MLNTLEHTELLRFTTAGSVDDGKSTLIGRLLYDSKSIFEDQYEAITQTSSKRGETGVNLALLTDGLKAEREQGITIDVAYRYFASPPPDRLTTESPRSSGVCCTIPSPSLRTSTKPSPRPAASAVRPA